MRGYIAAMNDDRTQNLPFMKMHGLGNDFVVLDARARDIKVTPSLAIAIADRHRGVGFDQLAVMSTGDKDLHLTFYNADGSLSAACGNATRCIARYVMEETGKSHLDLTTDRGPLQAVDAGNGLTSVNMGHPMTRWDQIPLAREVDTLSLPIEGSPVATGMGNPHCSFFVDDVADVDVPDLGARMEHHPLFPERTNVQVASVVGPDHLRMRVWERGVGMTLASGSSTCAVGVAAARRDLTGRHVRVDLDGGTMHVDWRDDGIWMTGPTAHVFTGTLTSEFIETLS